MARSKKRIAVEGSLWVGGLYSVVRVLDSIQIVQQTFEDLEGKGPMIFGLIRDFGPFVLLIGGFGGLYLLNRKQATHDFGPHGEDAVSDSSTEGGSHEQYIDFDGFEGKTVGELYDAFKNERGLRQHWEGTAVELQDAVNGLAARVEELEPYAPPPPGPRVTGWDDDPMPRIRIENDGKRETFTAQCILRRGNTGESNQPLPVMWEMGGGDSVQIAKGQSQWLRIDRPSILPEMQFKGQVEIVGADAESSTGGSMPRPDNPWIELEVNISTNEHQLVERFGWCSCCGFRHFGSLKP